jgi:hypothetical protein
VDARSKDGKDEDKEEEEEEEEDEDEDEDEEEDEKEGGKGVEGREEPGASGVAVSSKRGIKSPRTAASDRAMRW